MTLISDKSSMQKVLIELSVIRSNRYRCHDLDYKCILKRNEISFFRL